jgi:hypothetical protein
MSTISSGAIHQSDAAASNSGGSSAVKGDMDWLQIRRSAIRLVTALMLGFALANFIREYVDVTDIQDNEESAVQPKKKTNPYAAGILPLHELVRVGETVQSSCPHKALLPIQSVHNPIADAGEGRKIPKIVHMTGKTKCSTKMFVDATLSWTWHDHSFYFHDDQAVEKLLFQRDWPEFPQLKNSWECLKHSGGGKIKNKDQRCHFFSNACTMANILLSRSRSPVTSCPSGLVAVCGHVGIWRYIYRHGQLAGSPS